MKLELDNTTGHQISHYGSGSITINQTAYTQNLIVTPTTIVSPWEVRSIETLTTADYESLLALKPEIILLGCGETPIVPPPALIAWFAAKRIGVEVMVTGSACRTFNLLCSEGRQVVAGFIIPV